MIRWRIALVSLLSALGALPVGAEAESWLDGTMLKLKTMDFEFARSESDIPFIPVLSLGAKVYGQTEYTAIEGDTDTASSFRTRSVSACAMLPLYIGKRGMALAVPYIGYTRFHYTEASRQDESVTAAYLPVGALWQTEGGGQWGVFAMPAAYSPLSGGDAWAWSGMAGILGRYLDGRRLVWYYGAVYDYAFSDGYFLPYFGFSYILDPSWSISMIAPWPAVSYAPSDSFFVRLGVVPSGATWALEQEGDSRQAITSFGGWDLGVWANWRVTRGGWFAVGAGVSGLRSLQIDAGGDTSFDQSVSSEPWVSLSYSLRPQ